MTNKWLFPWFNCQKRNRELWCRHAVLDLDANRPRMVDRPTESFAGTENVEPRKLWGTGEACHATKSIEVLGGQQKGEGIAFLLPSPKSTSLWRRCGCRVCCVFRLDQPLEAQLSLTLTSDWDPIDSDRPTNCTWFQTVHRQREPSFDVSQECPSSSPKRSSPSGWTGSCPDCPRLPNQLSKLTVPTPVLGLRTVTYCTENEGTPRHMQWCTLSFYR